MKWNFVIREKLKIAFLLAGIVIIIALTSLVERSNIKDMDSSFSTIYYDRLIPATDIFFLTQKLYDKRLAIESYLQTSDNNVLALRQKLDSQNKSVRTLIVKFQNTYLVEEEQLALKAFNEKVTHYELIEADMLAELKSGSKENANQLYEKEGRPDLLLTIAQLEKLTRIQSEVGLDIVKESKNTISSSNLMMNLLITIGIIICLMVQALIIASKMVNRQDQNFHLN